MTRTGGQPDGAAATEAESQPDGIGQSEGSRPDHVVDVKDLVKRYKEVVALDHFDLSIDKGEIFGLLGPNGSGKTTAINCILQLLTYSRGEIKLWGEPMSPTRYDLKRRIGLVPQQVAVLPELSVTENIDYFCSLYVDDKARRRRLVGEAIEFTGLERFAKFRPKKLSGGLVRRLNIACGIAHQPSLILFDEPTVAVDPQSRNAILEGIRRLGAEGATVVYTSHYMEEVEQLCTRIMIMDAGRAVAVGTNAELKSMVGIGERIRVELDFPDDAVLAAVRALPHTQHASLSGQTLKVACAPGARNLADVVEALDRADVSYGRVFSEPPTLNDVFLELTGAELRD
ncbi:MAG: ABC transporter ATP-binding protein [Bifidobacteriaceae bacterium]|jgi:ABC-2 type transport system ATP-binding protein|nr:ABC transporter ATP-binding protein [Bifidobacteriaceae bacterium]